MAAALANPVWNSLAAAPSVLEMGKILNTTLLAPKVKQSDADAVALVVQVVRDPETAAAIQGPLEQIGFKTQAGVIRRLSEPIARDPRAREAFMRTVGPIQSLLARSGAGSSLDDLKIVLDGFFTNADGSGLSRGPEGSAVAAQGTGTPKIVARLARAAPRNKHAKAEVPSPAAMVSPKMTHESHVDSARGKDAVALRVAKIGTEAFREYASEARSGGQKQKLQAYHAFMSRLSSSLENDTFFIYPFMGPDPVPGLVRKTFPIDYDSQDFDLAQKVARSILGMDVPPQNLLYRGPLDVYDANRYGEHITKTFPGRRVLILKMAYTYAQRDDDFIAQLLRPGDMVLVLNRSDVRIMEALEPQGFSRIDDVLEDKNVDDAGHIYVGKVLSFPDTFGLWIKR
ncbi:MAG: hypothetical protein PHF00_10760 [Elusimicrobia bacterium]|nr:hypothetical protein [Elusimicrobiota bacterium]